MKKHVVTMVLLVVCAAMMAVVIMINLMTDREPPTISYNKEELVYDEREERTVLLGGVTARDGRDGDVSGSLIVKNLYRISDEQGIVIYAAKDSSNNVATASRRFTYRNTGEIQPGGNDPEYNNRPDDENIDEPNGNDQPSDPDQTTDPNTGTQNENPGGDTLTAQQYEQIKETQLAQGKPFIRLKQHEAALEQGKNFVVQRYIEELVDDKDDMDTLARHLRLGGDELDTSQAGTYHITVYVTDEDGNRSNVEEMQIKVE